MPDVDLVVVPLPSGRAGSVGTCSVLFAPRLRKDGVLGDWSDWKDWPAVLNPPAPQLSLRVLVNGAPVPHTPLSTPNSRIWRAVLPSTTRVQRHVYVDRTGSTFVSFDAGTLLGQVRDLYTAAAKAFPGRAPSSEQLLALPEAAALLRAPSGAGSLGAAEAYTDKVGAGTPQPLPKPEFHEWLSMLGGHSDLLRRLGLVLDLQLDLTGIASTSTLQVETGYAATMPGRRVAHHSIRTTPGFRALPDPDPTRREQVDGWLRCADSEYSVTQVDAAEAAVRLGPVGRTGAGAGLPVLRSGGVALQRLNSTARFVARLQRQDDLETETERHLEGAAATMPLLYSEDVTVGYRFDVLDRTGSTPTWRSLHARTPAGPYTLPRDAALVVKPKADEGTQVFTLTTDGKEVVAPAAGFGGNGESGPRHPHETRTGTFRVEPTLLTWYGWSLAAPRVGSVFDPSIGEGVPAPVATPDASSDVRLAVDWKATPKSLPRLRFGRSYSLRARAVDLAANSLPVAATAPPEAASPAQVFGRTEPVAAPVLMRRAARPDPGVHDATQSIVLRSDYDVLDSAVPPQSRQLLPPPVGQFLCELHGLPSGGVNAASYADLAARDAVRVEDAATVDPDTGELVWTATPNDPVTYLPDPAATGLAASGLPGSVPAATAPWTGTWPARRGGLLTVTAGSSRPPASAPTSRRCCRCGCPRRQRRRSPCPAPSTTRCCRRSSTSPAWHRPTRPRCANGSAPASTGCSPRR